MENPTGYSDEKKEEWEAPVLNILDIESGTEGAPAGTASGDGLGYS